MNDCRWLLVNKEREVYRGRTPLPFLMFSSLGRKFNKKKEISSITFRKLRKLSAEFRTPISVLHLSHGENRLGKQKKTNTSRGGWICLF